ncbi:MAG TPA: sensor histidine kinase [Puia sp.]|nr:sensor histidine kinase [Puia sp.]
MSIVPNDIEGRPARTGLYWLCQIAGWIVYACYHFYVNSVGYIDSLQKALLYCLLLAASGILLTALYRLLVLRLGWHDLPLLKLLPRVLIAVTLMAAALTWVNLRIEELTFPQFVQDITLILLIRTMGAWLELLFIYTFIYHLYIYYRRSLAAEKARAGAELSILRSQIHPHFYFNTLHNLYGLALERSPRTEEAILRLSDIMEYVIYDCRSEKVSLEKEIRFIQSYIELEKLRYGDELQIQVEMDIQHPGRLITPLLLIPFVENAFKHGAEQQEKNAYIYIHAALKGNDFHFEVINTARQGRSVTGGTGLDNVKRRLQYLYPGGHRLDMGWSDDRYTMKLIVSL